MQTLLPQLSTYTIVGKSRTTGSHYLTGVSSTIAKNGGRPPAARPVSQPMLKKKQLGWFEEGALPTVKTRSPDYGPSTSMVLLQCRNPLDSPPLPL